jgi:hypothetical protein
MSQDLWIANVRAEVEASTEYRRIYDQVIGWQLGHQLFEERPAWFEPAVRTLSDMVNDARIAYEAGRRYQRALDVYRLG